VYIKISIIVSLPQILFSENEEKKNPKRHHPRCLSSNNNNANVPSRTRARIRAVEESASAMPDEKEKETYSMWV
jgi:hypothetical protein